MSTQPQLRAPQLRALPPVAVSPVASSPGVAPERASRLVTLDLENAAHVQSVLSEFRRDCLVSGVDYGTIPSTPRATLYKPGAEKLMLFFGLSLEIEILSRTEDWEKNFVAYEVKAILRAKRSGEIEAEGIGNCNSNERKYKNQGGANCANTVLKMAKKRAFLDAVLTATRSSGLFMSEDGDDSEERPSHGTGSAPGREPQPQKGPQTRQNPPQPAANSTDPGAVALSASQWERCEQARKRAIELGFQSSRGMVPCALPQNTPVKHGWPLCQTWEAFIAREGAKEAERPADDDTPRYKIPDGARSKKCDCGAEIFFAPTRKGGSMPCDPDGTPHFITCSNADAHRKPRGGGAN